MVLKHLRNARTPIPFAPPRVHSLTSVRFFAALYVLFFHAQWGVTPGSPLARFLALGYISPYFFFVLSGYILAVVYLRLEQPVNPYRFFVSRFARIYPLYFVCLVLAIPFAVEARLAVYGPGMASIRVAGMLVRSAFMMQMWQPVNDSLNIPSWTVAIEAVFYLTFPWIGPRLWRLSRKAAAAGMAVLCVTGLGLDWMLEHTFPDAPPAYRLGSFLTVFAAGVLLARSLWLGEKKSSSYGRGNAAVWSVASFAALAFTAAVLGQGWLKERDLNPAYVLTPVYLVAIWALTHSDNFALRWLNAKWLVVLGEASYALYLLQNPISNLLRSLNLTGSPWNYPLYLGLCIGLSVLSFYFFESPSRQWILHRLHTPTKETMEVASVAQ
jgi:peptidoglycan/LPS O-acetylase OafA/YrhL